MPKLKMLDLFLAPLYLKIRGRIVGAFSKITMAIYIGFGLVTVVSITLLIILANLHNNSGMLVSPEKNIENKAEETLQEQSAVIVISPQTVSKVNEEAKTERKEMEQQQGQEQREIVKPIQGVIQVDFGWQLHRVYNDWRYHTGVDIKGSTGQSVKTVYKGQVMDIFRDQHSGLTVLVKDDSYDIYYGSLAEVTVDKGSFIGPNQMVGKMGSCDAEPDVHLHLAIKKGEQYIDPKTIVPIE